MSDNVAISVENVSKVFRLGVKEQASENLTQAFAKFVRSPLDNYRKYRSLYKFDDLDPNQSTPSDADSGILWALKDVNFKVNKGEVLGVIGHNGAGKSTLLKVITRITPPTKGQIQIRGRVASLLEVGTGFHPELTGRENVYLNGTILGMRKKEVDAKFDEIVDFSGVEKFLDTPVKRYSSGMRVRLAFSVAAHLEPEILIIDEVLAVGDAAFQSKCLNKMQQVGQDGKTVLFVSHNMPAINMLCDRAVLLKGGQVIADDRVSKVISGYLTAGTGSTASREWSPEEAPGGEVAKLVSTRVVKGNGELAESASVSDEVFLEMEYDVIKEGHVLLPHFHLFNSEGMKVFTTLDQDPTWYKKRRPKGHYISRVKIPAHFLQEGSFYVNTHLLARNPDMAQFTERQVLAFTVTDEMGDGTARGDWAGTLDGMVRPLLDWETISQDASSMRCAS